MKTWLALIISAIVLIACSQPPTPTSQPFDTQPAVEALATPSPTLIVRPTNTPDSPPTPSLARTPTPPLVTLILWESLPQAQAEKLREDIAAFNQNYPNYLFDVQHYDTPETLVTAILEGHVDYDLILGPSSLLAPLQQGNKLQAMAEFFSASFLNGFASATLIGATRQGRLWGLPDSAGFQLLLFYNRDLIELPPKTTAELVEAAQSLTTGSQWGLVLNSQDPLWVVPWVWAYGGWLTDGDGSPTLNSEAMIQALTLHASWHKPPTLIAPVATHIEARELFTSDRAAMMIDGEWAIEELSQGTAVPWGVAMLPVIEEADQSPSPLVLARYWAIGSETTGSHVEAATAFLEFITQADRQLAWTQSFGLLPTRREALNSPQILTDPALRISAQQLQAGRGVPLNTNLNEILDAMRSPLAQLLGDTLTPAEAAALMQENIQ